MDLFGQGMEKGAEVDGLFRFSLFRRWDRARPWTAWLMCNPSTADAEEDDPTVRRVVHFSKRVGGGGALIVNVWPFRTPYPTDLWPALRRGDVSQEAIQRNLAAIRDAADKAFNGFVAFGAEPARRYPDAVAVALEAFAPARVSPWRPMCLGTNPDGFPLHPLARGKFAIPNDREPVLWERPSVLDGPYFSRIGGV